MSIPAAEEPVVDSRLHKVLQDFQKEGGEVQYLGHAYGLDGWLMAREGMQPQTAYTTAEGGLVLGPLADADGNIESVRQLSFFRAKAEGRSQAALPGAEKTAARPSERFYAEVENAGWVRAGKEDAPYIYMFMNVTCDHCQAYWKSLQKPIADGRLQVRLLPFGAKPENRDTGAALLSVANPAEAWTKFINGDKAALSADKAAADAAARIDANGEMLRRWKVATTPFTIYRRLTDGQVTVVSGKPDNAMLILADLIPAQ